VNVQAKATSGRYLTFRVDSQLYALPSQHVGEVMLVPPLARIPQAPAALLGVANLRGSVLPVASLRTLLAKPEASELPDARAIVLDVGAPVAVVVDAVEALEHIEAAQIETRQKELSAEGEEKLIGAFPVGRDNVVAKILDIQAMLELAFINRGRAERQVRTSHGVNAAAARRAASNAEMLVTFEVAGQEFALPLKAVQEILPVPAAVTSVAHADAVVLGMTSVRDQLLPVMSLRRLLGFSAAQLVDGREKVIVANVAGSQVGLVADDARSVLAADAELVEPIPAVLAARTGGESRIRSIFRGEGGRRLVSILSPELLFREDIMHRLAAAPANENSRSAAVTSDGHAELIFLVFRLGDSEFGLPIDSVVEVAPLPPQITRLPKTPKFLEGIVNLRGEVLPVVDQRRRFDMPTYEQPEARRLVVVRTQRHRAGIIVDSVSDVLRTREASIKPPPDLTDATTRLVRGVINLEEADRMVLVLDATELLTQAEEKLLDSFQAGRKKANA
jgi:purine-binding chemotaxis protein CheW